MKILFVSNFYPPHHVGGYELRCSQVAEYLQRAGHEVRVLTSSYRLPEEGTGTVNIIDECSGGVPVERSLRYHPLEPQPPGRFYILSMARRQLPDARRFVKLLDDFQPDIVNWWNLEGLTKAILPIPAGRRIPDVHFVEDTWLIREYGLCGEKESLFWFDFWRGNWGSSFFRPILRRTLAPWARRVQGQGIPTRPIANHPRHVCFVSEFMKLEHIREGLVFPSSEVIYGGVSPEGFYAQRAMLEFKKAPLRLLYAGYISPNRGLHTIIEALGLLPLDLRKSVELSIAHTGPAKPSQYVENILARIERLGLSKNVAFLGKIPHSQMPRVYLDHHVLVSASTRKEGLPLTMMEGMCAGCAVITTGSGGAAEIADLADLPIFPQDDPVALSRLIAKLVTNPELVFQIATHGQAVVMREFTFARMMERLGVTFGMVVNEEKRQTRNQTLENKQTTVVEKNDP